MAWRDNLPIPEPEWFTESEERPRWVDEAIQTERERELEYRSQLPLPSRCLAVEHSKAITKAQRAYLLQAGIYSIRFFANGWLLVSEAGELLVPYGESERFLKSENDADDTKLAWWKATKAAIESDRHWRKKDSPIR